MEVPCILDYQNILCIIEYHSQGKFLQHRSPQYHHQCQRRKWKSREPYFPELHTEAKQQSKVPGRAAQKWDTHSPQRSGSWYRGLSKISGYLWERRKNRYQIMWKGKSREIHCYFIEQTEDLERSAHFKILPKGKQIVCNESQIKNPI